MCLLARLTDLLQMSYLYAGFAMIILDRIG